MAIRRRVLVIDEDAAFRRYASHVLSSMDFEVIEATHGRAGINELQQWTPDCVIVDLDLPDIPGQDILKTVAVSMAPRPPVVAMSANLTVSMAVEAMKAGAKDAIEKPISTDRLRQMVLEAMDGSDLARDLAEIDAVGADGVGDEILESEVQAMISVVDRVRRLASVEMPVIIVGERGTGTAAMARRLHGSGTRKDRPFVEVAAKDDAAEVCASLFGGEGRTSAFAQAEDGTIFIESLASLGTPGQERLSRFLSEVRDARASGQPIKCPRIVAACEAELQAEVSAGRVSEELAHRLSPLTVTVPPLRDRKKDIPNIVSQMVDRVANSLGRASVAVSDEVMQHLIDRDWPGNFDELHSIIVRGVVLARDGRLRLEDVVGPSASHNTATVGGVSHDGWHPTLDSSGAVRRFDDYEAEIFRYALDKAGGCVSRAAETLGVGRATMYRKMRSYDIDAPPVSERAIIRTGRKRKKAAAPTRSAA